MFKTDGNMILAPTHEEEITSLVASLKSSYRNLPLRLYQIGEKFRNEARPRGGLLRCREFVMKDLYTFDRTEKEAQDTYQQVCRLYRTIFTQLGLKFYQAQASSGAIGGSCSHEFHLECQSGQDTILSCDSCHFIGNQEVFPLDLSCPKCHGTKISSKRGLEIGHTFLLGTKYSRTLDAKYKDQNGKEIVMEMGCYGIGVSRLLAAIIEASHDENGIIWPSIIAPFQYYIIPFDNKAMNSLPHCLETGLLDDRPNLSFSHKFKDALLTGIPNILILGGKKSSTGIEWHKRQIGGTELQSI
jgi:prolyl-tRNA synthetase